MYGIVGIILLVFFIIIIFLVVGLVLLQNEEGDSLGGLFVGGSNSAFGSRSGNILTKTTYTLIVCFFVVSFALAWHYKSSGDSGLEKEALDKAPTEWWNEAGSKNEADEKQEKAPEEETKSENTSASDTESSSSTEGSNSEN